LQARWSGGCGVLTADRAAEGISAGVWLAGAVCWVFLALTKRLHDVMVWVVGSCFFVVDGFGLGWVLVVGGLWVVVGFYGLFWF